MFCCRWGCRCWQLLGAETASGKLPPIPPPHVVRPSAVSAGTPRSPVTVSAGISTNRLSLAPPAGIQPGKPGVLAFDATSKHVELNEDERKAAFVFRGHQCVLGRGDDFLHQHQLRLHSGKVAVHTLGSEVWGGRAHSCHGGCHRKNRSRDQDGNFGGLNRQLPIDSQRVHPDPGAERHEPVQEPSSCLCGPAGCISQ